MSYDVECPYCGEGQEINHDDGYGYGEDDTHEQQCGECDKNFAYTTAISFDHYASKADCLNGGDHNYEVVMHVPSYWPDWKRCMDCGHEIHGKMTKPADSQ